MCKYVCFRSCQFLKKFTFILSSDELLSCPQEVGAHTGHLIQKVPSWNVIGIPIGLRLQILNRK